MNWVSFLKIGLVGIVLLGNGVLNAAPAPLSDNALSAPEAPRSPTSVAVIPRSGDQPLLIILADFPDRFGLFTGQAWRNVFFGTAGFVDYFEEVSYNQLRYLSGDVAGLSGGVPVTNSASVAYVRLPNPITYYADGQYGFKIGSAQFPKNHGGVVYHALQALNTAGFNFAPYANPSTNVVENVVVIFAGSTYAYTQDPVNSLEATAYRMTWAGAAGPFVASGGQTIDAFTFCPDQRLNLSGLIGYIGVCSHEHGHALGMFDLYDFSYTTSGAGKFDIMGYGTFGATSGQRPFHFSAFSKEFFGWVTPTVAASGTNNYVLGPAETGASFIRLYPNGNTNSPEYFLLENRQPLGFDQDWLSASLCAGLVIWHIDQTIVQDYSFVNLVNTLSSYPGGPPHQGVIVVEADGGYDMITPPFNDGDCADIWTVGQTWNASSTPNSNLWDGSPSNLAVTVAGTCANGGLFLNITVGGANLTLNPNLLLPQIPLTNTKLYLPTIMRNAC